MIAATPYFRQAQRTQHAGWLRAAVQDPVDYTHLSNRVARKFIQESVRLTSPAACMLLPCPSTACTAGCIVCVAAPIAAPTKS